MKNVIFWNCLGAGAPISLQPVKSLALRCSPPQYSEPCPPLQPPPPPHIQNLPTPMNFIFKLFPLYNCICQMPWPGRVAQSVGHLTRKSRVLGSIPGLATYFRFSPPLFQEGQLSVTGESMCTKYWLTA